VSARTGYLPLFFFLQLSLLSLFFSQRQGKIYRVGLGAPILEKVEWTATAMGQR
jgi:hypothetical protein